MIDNSLYRYAVGKKDTNYANRLENIVFVELLRSGYTVDVGKLDVKEIEFITRKADKILYVQVTYDMPTTCSKLTICCIFVTITV